jgi:hypothetical protein
MEINLYKFNNDCYCFYNEKKIKYFLYDYYQLLYTTAYSNTNSTLAKFIEYLKYINLYLNYTTPICY